jgi:hypothetical protein
MTLCLAALVALVSLAGLPVEGKAATNRWYAGAAKVAVTPAEPIWLAGYASRNQPSEGVLQDIYVKALALKYQDDSAVVILTSDLMGFSHSMIEEVRQKVERQFGLLAERLLMNASHSHSSPVTTGILPLYYELDEQQQGIVARYTQKLSEKMVEVIGAALKNLEPSDLAFEQGLAGFAVNRRRSRPGLRKLPGPVDHDVPVLRVRDMQGKLRFVVMGYACHSTTLSGYQISGDYAGFAQAELEQVYPGSIALFVAGCGADINPLPRIMRSSSEDAAGLARMYGRILAAAVGQVLDGPMKSLEGPIATALRSVNLPFQPPPKREEVERLLPGASGIRKRQIHHLLSLLESEMIPTHCAYPVQVWQFGQSLTLIGLAGEPVVDYSLRFKKEYGADTVWVAGYCNELCAYIPSLRISKEGGYEGGDAAWEYGLPAPFDFTVEERIAGTVDELVKKAQRAK